MNQLLLVISVVILSTGCTFEKIEIPEPLTACDTLGHSYSLNIAPIITTYCTNGLGPLTGCHDAWILEYDGLKNVIDDGRFYDQVYVQRRMPPIPNDFGISFPSEEELIAIQCWMDNGAPND